MVNKIMVKTTLSNGKERFVELDRGSLSLEKLKAELQRKSGQKGQWHLKAGPKALHNDADLLSAVVEAEKAKERFLIVDIVGGTAPVPPRTATSGSIAARPSGAPTPAASTRPQATPQQAQQPSRASAAAPAPVVVQQDTGVFTVFVVNGSPSGIEKPKVNAVPEGRNYVFSVSPARQEVTVEVVVNPKQLQFKLTTGSLALAQSFNLPFEFTINDLSMRGDSVVLAIPGF
eukprot:TRINITY_DN8753_c0_g4_i1.p1 TRINITY_DN8753_c0_g4~~TRINITY_DN8753_c0_g4_i1.p1  ORF type:complete len:231 (+),score=54.41 TRINITY_DN8753_c0_g4_i1:64-756(+)